MPSARTSGRGGGINEAHGEPDNAESKGASGFWNHNHVQIDVQITPDSVPMFQWMGASENLANMMNMAFPTAKGEGMDGALSKEKD